MIQLNSVSHSYKPNQPVLKTTSANWSLGHVIGLLGCNGAGKTSLLRLLAGLRFADQGSVTLNGDDVSQRTPKAMAEILFMPDTLALPALTLSRYASCYRDFYPNFSAEKLQQCAAAFQIPLDKDLNSLSHGQQKKAWLAFALACQVRILLLDEPTNGLDIPSKAVFRKLLAEYINDDRMVLISSHEITDVAGLLDHVVIMHEQQLVLDASVAALSQRLSFVTQAQRPEKSIYAEPCAGGFACVLADDNSQGTEIDYTLLFNAATQATAALQAEVMPS